MTTVFNNNQSNSNGAFICCSQLSLATNSSSAESCSRTSGSGTWTANAIAFKTTPIVTDPGTVGMTKIVRVLGQPDWRWS
jgi:hypothetical protein